MTLPDFLILIAVTAAIVFAGGRLAAALNAWLDEQDDGKGQK